MQKMPSAWWSVALVMLALTGNQCRADEMTDKALRAFQTKAPDLQATVKSDNELLLKTRTGRMSVFLYNIRTGCAANAATCDEEIAAFVDHMSASVSTDLAGAFVAERVHAVLRPPHVGRRFCSCARCQKHRSALRCDVLRQARPHPHPDHARCGPEAWNL